MSRKRLLWQLSPSYLGITVVSLLAAGWLVFWYLNHFYQSAADADLLARARLAAGVIEGPFKQGRTDELASICAVVAEAAEARILVVDATGKAVADSDAARSRVGTVIDLPEIKSALEGKPLTSRRFSYTLNQDMLNASVPILEAGAIRGAVAVAVPQALLQEAVSGVRTRFAIISLAILGLAVAASFYVSRRIVQPLEEMKRGAEKFARGELGGRLSPAASKEIGGLADALNQMAERLDDRIRAVLRQSNEQEAVLTSMVEGVLAIDEHERIINLNQSAAELLGIDAGAAKGRHIQEVVRNPDLQRFAKRALASKVPVEGELIMNEGKESLMQAHGTVLRDEHGSGIGAVIVINDITHLRRLENVRRDFVANVSHELKTPVTSIKGFVETLQEGAIKNPEDAQRFLEIIARQTDRLGSIIEDLLSLSRIEQESDRSGIVLEEARLAAILQSAIDDCAMRIADKNIKVQIHCDETLKVRVNPPLLEQAIVNLIDNAVKYSEAEKTIEIGATKDSGVVRISVRDEGCGIEPEHLPRVFERFYRVDKARSRKLGGTGLGLAIVKHIAQAHGGSVTAESLPGKGSTFTIHLV